MTETYTATLDRIVDGETAVLLLEGDEAVVDQLDVDVGELPSDGRHEGAVFEVTVDDGALSGASYRPEVTEDRRESAQDRLDRLSERLSDRE